MLSALETPEPARETTRFEAYLLGEIPDCRRHRRIIVSLPLRFLARGGVEARGLTFDMSPGGLSVSSSESPAVGAPVVAYIDDLGRVEGTVSRHHPYGFALGLTGTQRQRDKLAERLTFYANRHLLSAEDMRRHERIAVDRETVCVLADGKRLPCRVVDLSLSGAAVEIGPKPPVGTDVLIGRMRGEVIRHFPQGVGVRFLDLALSHATVRERIEPLA